MNYKLNYTFQKHDSRDFKFAPTTHYDKNKNKLPDNFTITRYIGKILDQGNLGSCVSNAFAKYINIRSNNTVKISRLFHYYCGRAIEGDSSLEDTGLDIRQAAKIIAKYGACPEQACPYDISKFNSLPSLDAFKQSKYFKKYTYSFVDQDIESLKKCIHNTNSPIIFGINVYSSFFSQEVANTGEVPIPNINIEKLEGGHCILMIGYNDDTRKFKCLNSWGNNWGSNGIFYLPYDYVTDSNLAADFCTLNISI